MPARPTSHTTSFTGRVLLLTTTRDPRLTTHDSLLPGDYLLLVTAHCSLVIIYYCSLLTAHCSLLTAHCSPLTAHCSLLTAHCSPLTAPSMSFIDRVSQAGQQAGEKSVRDMTPQNAYRLAVAPLFRQVS